MFHSSYNPGDRVWFKRALPGELVKCVIVEYMLNSLDDSVTYKLKEINGDREYRTNDPSRLILIDRYTNYDICSVEPIKRAERGIFTTSRKSFMPHPKKVIFNGEVTVVLWDDGTKTIVRCDCTKYEYSKEKAVMYAAFKKIFGNTTKMLKYIQEFEKASGEDVLPKEEREVSECSTATNADIVSK